MVVYQNLRNYHGKTLLTLYTVNFETMIYYGKNYSTIYTENCEIFIYYGKYCSTIPKAIELFKQF